MSSGQKADPVVPVEEPQTGRFRRSRDGVTIHRFDCHRATKAVPWLFADDKTDDFVFAAVVSAPWLKPCRICKPLRISGLVDGQVTNP